MAQRFIPGSPFPWRMKIKKRRGGKASHHTRLYVANPLLGLVTVFGGAIFKSFYALYSTISPGSQVIICGKMHSSTRTTRTIKT
jgi:hypothetical protein